jgi:hypothetical protein
MRRGLESNRGDEKKGGGGQRPPKKEWVNSREFSIFYVREEEGEREEVRKWRKG